jgi:hypothetical protein
MILLSAPVRTEYVFINPVLCVYILLNEVTLLYDVWLNIAGM